MPIREDPACAAGSRSGLPWQFSVPHRCRRCLGREHGHNVIGEVRSGKVERRMWGWQPLGAPRPSCRGRERLSSGRPEAPLSRRRATTGSSGSGGIRHWVLPGSTLCRKARRGRTNVLLGLPAVRGRAHPPPAPLRRRQTTPTVLGGRLWYVQCAADARAAGSGGLSERCWLGHQEHH